MKSKEESQIDNWDWETEEDLLDRGPFIQTIARTLVNA